MQHPSDPPRPPVQEPPPPQPIPPQPEPDDDDDDDDDATMTGRGTRNGSSWVSSGTKRKPSGERDDGFEYAWPPPTGRSHAGWECARAQFCSSLR